VKGAQLELTTSHNRPALLMIGNTAQPESSTAAPSTIDRVEHWTEELKQRVPSK
jgi:hypothetical protein